MRSNVIAYDESAPLANILSFLVRAPIRGVIITSQGKPTGLVTRAAIVRWFLENRWNRHGADFPLEPTSNGHAATIAGDSDTTMATIAAQLVALADELRCRLAADPAVCDPAPLVGGTSRMQQLLDDLLSSSSRRAASSHGLPF